MEKIEELLLEMIRISDLKDVTHLVKVWGYAQTIGRLEKLDEREQYTLELAAIIHDISCPLCREKYGSARGDLQEMESPNLVDSFLKDRDIPDEIKERIKYLVCHHHTTDNVDGMDYRILLEADFLVNAEEMNLPKDKITEAKDIVFKTKSGLELLNILYKNNLQG